MQSHYASCVVCLVGSDDPEPFAHFLSPTDADRYARTNINSRGIERAYVFGVVTTATRTAFSAVLNGEAELVDVAVHGALQSSRRGWRIHASLGTRATGGHGRDTQFLETLSEGLYGTPVSLSGSNASPRKFLPRLLAHSIHR